MKINEFTKEVVTTETTYDLLDLTKQDMETLLYCLDFVCGDIPGYYANPRSYLEQAIRQALG